MDENSLLAENKVDEQKTLKSPAEVSERRSAQRLCYDWPVWFAEESEKAFPTPESFEGQMVDVSSAGAAFTFHPEKVSLRQGQEIITRFRIPRFRSLELFNKVVFTRIGHVSRIHKANSSQCKAVIKFNRPLFFEPGEQGLTDTEARQKLEAIRT